MSDLSMLINGLKVSAEKGATFERRNPLDGTVATRAPAAVAGRCGDGGGGRGRSLQHLERDRSRRTPRAAAEGRREAGSQDAVVHRGGAGRDRRHRHVGRLQRDAGGRHAARGGVAHHAGGGRGDPVRRAGLAGDGPARAGRRGARHRAVERADHPGRARHRHAAGLRQHRGPEGQRELPAHAPADHRSACRRPAFRRVSSTT